MLHQPLADTVALPHIPALSTAGFVRRSWITRLVARLAQAVRLKAQSQAQVAAELSGGNQQKVLLARLLEVGLEICQQPGEAAHRDRDQRVRDANWWPLSALQHRMGRWGDINSAREMREHKLVTAQDLHARFGAPPVAVDAPDTDPLVLPDTPDDARDQLLRKRATCRNFDALRALALPLVAQVLKVHKVPLELPEYQV